jgi:hypothetical protein
VDEKRRRERGAERLGGFQVDDQLRFGRLLERQVSRLGALEDLVHIGDRSPGDGAIL